MGFENITTNKENVVKYKRNKKKNGKTWKWNWSSAYLSSYSNYHFVAITVMLHLSSFANLKKCLNACRHFVVVTYHLQYPYIFYHCCLPSTTLLYPLQPLNPMVIFMC
jgi:hypothetical protein